jgi:signal peptidase II
VIEILTSASMLLLLDQWSKRLVARSLPDRPVAWGSVLTIRHVVHRKAAYQRHGARAVLVVTWIAALLAAIVLHRSGEWFHGQAALVGLGLALGGGAGNLLDVLRHRHVVDFIDLGWWPVFNVADVGIVAGLALAFWPRG